MYYFKAGEQEWYFVNTERTRLGQQQQEEEEEDTKIRRNVPMIVVTTEWICAVPP